MTENESVLDPEYEEVSDTELEKHKDVEPEAEGKEGLDE